MGENVGTPKTKITAQQIVDQVKHNGDGSLVSYSEKLSKGCEKTTYGAKKFGKKVTKVDANKLDDVQIITPQDAYEIIRKDKKLKNQAGGCRTKKLSCNIIHYSICY